MTVVLERPYKFVPPNRSDFWPTLIQRLRIVDRYLRKKEGVVSYECRQLDLYREAIERGVGILLAPNHCRYADPLVLGWPARETRRNVYAMASWHLFNEGWLDAFAIQRMGGFSVFREGVDRQSLEMAIEILVEAKRPLILFPEGTTNRTNDVLKPLLDGVAFIARAAARKRAKQCGGKVVIQPLAIKYLCQGDVSPWADRQLAKFESTFGWHAMQSEPILSRTLRVAEAMLSLREIEHLGQSRTGNLAQRRDELIENLLVESESHLKLAEPTDRSLDTVRARVRAIRAEVHARWFSSSTDDREKVALRLDVRAADLAQELMSYPNSYLHADQATDTRIVETIQRMQESFFGKADVSMPLHAVVEFDTPVDVPTEKAPRGIEDPLLTHIRFRLTEMLARLSTEARPLKPRSSGIKLQ